MQEKYINMIVSKLFETDENILCAFYTKFLSSDVIITEEEEYQIKRDAKNQIQTIQVWVITKKPTEAISQVGEELKSFLKATTGIKLAFASSQVDDCMNLMPGLLEQLVKGTIVFDKTNVFLNYQNEARISENNSESPIR